MIRTTKRRKSVPPTEPVFVEASETLEEIQMDIPTEAEEVIFPVVDLGVPSRRRRSVGFAFLGIIFFLLCLGVYLIWWKKDPQGGVTKEDVERTVAQVGQLIVLPKDELPTLATVSDLDRLKGNEFFKDAKVGDKVLIYTKARKVILYSTALNKIVEVAPLTLPATPASSSVR